jgi:hypothetical protein
MAGKIKKMIDHLIDEKSKNVMKIIKASSIQETSVEAVEEIKSAFKDFKPKMFLFFASSKYAPESISSEMKAAFPGSSVIGCSTSGEIVSGEMLKGSVVAMGLIITNARE